MEGIEARQEHAPFFAGRNSMSSVRIDDFNMADHVEMIPLREETAFPC